MKLCSPALVLIMLAAAALYGCGSPAQDGQRSSVLASEPTHIPADPGSRSTVKTVELAPETPTVAPVRSTPMPITQSGETPPPHQADEQFEVFPNSPRAGLGKPYPLVLNIHCGLDYDVDFDGSFWKLDGRREVPEKYLGGGVPELEGTMTLMTHLHARFDFDPASVYTNLRPSRASVYFVRHEGRRILDYPCQ